MVGTSARPASFAARSRPCPAMMTPCSSIRIGLVKPNSLIEALICSSCRLGCVRALRGSGLRLLTVRYSSSAALLRHCLAWRLQAEALGGLDRDTRRQLKRRQRVQAEGLALGVGTTLQREWQGQIVQVTVEEEGFRHKGQLFKSLSAAATAIAGTRWNGPRFFGLRSTK